jgi:glutathione synthase/RimK-type ligase-like ATP-grasp enzyme
MQIKLAIHNKPGSFSDRWIQYCSEHGINYTIVNCYDSDIIDNLKTFDGLLWHWAHCELADQLIARGIITAVEKMDVKIFPNIATCWHYDDKISQKYLLETIGAPLIPSYVFYDKEKAKEWIDKTKFPKVFKLSCGAGSQNVKLVTTREQAKKLCEKAFREGFNPIGTYFSDIKTKVRKVRTLNDLITKLQRMPKSIFEISKVKRLLTKQRGYIYFQDFLPDNDFDTRITVIGSRAFGFTRNTRQNDFRASGSGDIICDMNRIDKRCIKIAFNIVQKLKTQSLAFDFLFDQNNDPKIAEISYCYQNIAVHSCPGYWDNRMNWHEGHIWPEDAIMADLLKEISLEKKDFISFCNAK